VGLADRIGNLDFATIGQACPQPRFFAT
jgi:hypothetical protein